MNVNSNHPRTIIEQIANTVNLRINRLSSCKKIFEDNKGTYNEAVYNSSFHKKCESLYLRKVNTNE